MENETRSSSDRGAPRRTTTRFEMRWRTKLDRPQIEAHLSCGPSVPEPPVENETRSSSDRGPWTSPSACPQESRGERNSIVFRSRQTAGPTERPNTPRGERNSIVFRSRHRSRGGAQRALGDVENETRSSSDRGPRARWMILTTASWGERNSIALGSRLVGRVDRAAQDVGWRTKLDRSRIEVLARRRDVAMKTRSLSD